jgi:hypothetical protein
VDFDITNQLLIMCSLSSTEEKKWECIRAVDHLFIDFKEH